MDQPQQQAGAGECCMPVYCKKYSVQLPIQGFPKFLTFESPIFPVILSVKQLKHLKTFIFDHENFKHIELLEPG